MKNKKSKIIVPALGLILLSTAASISGSVAWFSMNRTVSAEGMKVTAETAGSLVISDAMPTNATGTTSVNFADASATILRATTHDSTWATYANGLKYNTNPTAVAADTGLGNGLTFASAVNNTPTGVNYYKDYNVYIASSGAELQHQDIAISLTNSAVLTLPGATSIDFYKNRVSVAGTITPSNDTFVGTLNLAKLHPTTNDASTALNSITISDITVPAAAAGQMTQSKF